MAGAPKYSRAPIVEAVFEFQFDEALSARDLERARDRFKTRYPAVEERKNISVQVRPDGKVSTESVVIGYQMAAADARSLVLMQTNAFGTVRPAPYEDWDHLIDVAKENYEIFEKIVGHKTFNRISSRFVNRIDIPDSSIKDLDYSAWLNVGVKLPPKFAGTDRRFSFASVFTHGETGLQVLVQGGTIEPVLLNYTSVMLDIDVYIDKEIRQRKDVLWEIAGLLRSAKNSIFEELITDKLRNLIS